MVRKELREYARNRPVVIAMGVIPFIFLVQPLIAVFNTASAAAITLRHHHELLYLLAVPALVPATLAAYAVVGEREQGTLEPVLTTPVQREELVLAKSLAVLTPAIVISYVAYALFLILVALFAHPGIPSALIRSSDIVAQVVFTPLIASWSIWLALAISTRVTEVRVAQQLSVLVSLPSVALSTLFALNVIHPTFGLAVVVGAVLLAANRLGWRVVSALFDRERLIAGSR
jgi:ABC-2 type transport system permease protein